MTEPANPLDNQAAIAQINNAINFLISEFLRPTAQQSAANVQAITGTNQGIQELKQLVEIS